MSEALRKEEKVLKQKISYQDSLEVIKKTHSEELIIGICGLIGTDIHRIARNLSEVISNQFSYECKIIKLSEFINEYGIRF